MNNNMNEEKAKELGELLGESPIADEIKEAILENLAKIPMNLVDDLIESLKNEKSKISEVIFEIEEFFKKQDKEWEELAVTQRTAAEEIIENEIRSIEESMK